MDKHSETRRHPRYISRTPVYIYQEEYVLPYPKGVVLNFSREGAYFQAEEKLRIGDHVYIRIENYDPGEEGIERYWEYSGFVRWSEELGTSYHNGSFGYGIQYEKPVEY